MEFKKAIKRIVALGTGASMVGATIFGAMAADLANYPNQYIKDGKFTGVLVVGDKAAADDVIGVSVDDDGDVDETPLDKKEVSTGYPMDPCGGPFIG